MTFPVNLAKPASGLKGLTFIVAVAGAVRLLYFLLFQRSPLFDLYVADQIYYRYWAMQIAGGDWLGREVFEQGPLYAYLLGGMFKLCGPSLQPVLALQFLIGTATVTLIWWTARQVAGNGAALAAGLLAALYGPLIFYEGLMMKSFLEPLLVMLTLAAALKGDSTGRARWHALAGLSLGLACLVREAHLLLLLPLIMVSLQRPKISITTSGKRLLPVLALITCFVLTLIPTTVRNLLVGGEFVPVTSGGGEVAYMSFGPTANGYYSPPYFVTPHPFTEHQDFRKEAYFRTLTPMNRNEASSFWYREAIREVAASPGRILELMLRKAVILFNDNEVPDSENYDFTARLMPALGVLPTFGWITGLGCVGGLILWRSGRRGRFIIFLTAMLILEVLLTYNYGRFRLALCAVWLVLAGIGVARLCQAEFWRGRRKNKRVVASILVLALVAVLSWTPPPITKMASNFQALEGLALEAGEKRSFIPRLQQESAERPDDPDPRYYLGMSFWATGMISEAIETYQGLLRVRSDDPDTHRELASIYRDYGPLESAARHARILTELMPNDFTGHYLSGVISLDQGIASAAESSSAQHFTNAVGELSIAASLKPGDVSIHHTLGKALYFAGNVPAATKEMLAALAIDPSAIQVAYDLDFIRQWSRD